MSEYSDSVYDNFHNGNKPSDDMVEQALNDKEILKSFSIPLEDPAVTRVMDVARALDESLANDNLSGDDIRHQISSLDKSWPYLHKRLTISGKIWKYDEDGYKQIDADSLTGISRGFSIYRHTWYKDGDEFSERRVCHYIDEPGAIKPIFAEIDAVAVTYPFVSVEHSRDKLYYHYADMMDRIDERTSEAQTDVEFLNYLKTLEIDVAKMTRSEQSELQSDLSNHLTHMADLDIEAPYVYDVKGAIITISESGTKVPKTLREPTPIMGMGMKILMIGKSFFNGDVSDRTKLVPVMLVRHFLPERNDSQKIWIPLYSVENLTSLREMIYRTQEESND